MTRVDLDYVKTVPAPKVILMIGRGDSGKGGGIIRNEKWQALARANSLGLVGISYASAPGVIHGGDSYYHAAKGSGQILEKEIRKSPLVSMRSAFCWDRQRIPT